LQKPVDFCTLYGNVTPGTIIRDPKRYG